MTEPGNVERPFLAIFMMLEEEHEWSLNRVLRVVAAQGFCLISVEVDDLVGLVGLPKAR